MDKTNFELLSNKKRLKTFPKNRIKYLIRKILIYNKY